MIFLIFHDFTLTGKRGIEDETYLLVVQSTALMVTVCCNPFLCLNQYLLTRKLLQNGCRDYLHRKWEVMKVIHKQDISQYLYRFDCIVKKICLKAIGGLRILLWGFGIITMKRTGLGLSESCMHCTQKCVYGTTQTSWRENSVQILYFIFRIHHLLGHTTSGCTTVQVYNEKCYPFH